MAEEAGAAEPEMILVTMTVVIVVEAEGMIMTMVTTEDAVGVADLVAMTAMIVQAGVVVMMVTMIITMTALAGVSVMIRATANQSVAHSWLTAQSLTISGNLHCDVASTLPPLSVSFKFMHKRP